MKTLVMWAVCAAALAALPAAAAADPRGFAMGGTDAAVAHGADAVPWNAALLGLPDAPGFSARLFQAGARADNNSFDLDQYRRLNGATWGDAQKSEILGSVPAGGLQLQAQAAGGTGISLGRFGIYAGGLGAGDGSFSRDGVDIALYGDALDRTYQVTGSGGRAYAAARLVAGFAIPLRQSPEGSSAVGLEVALERGLRWEEASTEVGTFEATLDTAQALGDFRLREGTHGTGVSLGVGYAYLTSAGARFSLAVRDLWNQTRWTGTDRRYHLSGSHGVHGTQNLDSLFSSTEDPALPADFTTRRAPVASLGLEQAGGSTTISLLLEKGLGESPGVSKQVRTALGLEWSGFGPLQLRGGVSLGGGQGTWFSGGVGARVGPWRLDAAVASRGLSYGTRGVGVAVGSSLGL